MRFALILAWSLAVGCSAERRPAMLSDLAAYSGGLEVQIRPGDGTARLRGHLEFDRASGRIRFSQPRNGAMVEFAKDGDAALRMSRDGVSGAAELDELGDFALLQQLLFSPPEAAARIETIAGGYAIVIGDRRIEVAMTPDAPRGG